MLGVLFWIAVLGGIVGIAFLQAHAIKQRREYLLEKYSDPELVDRLMKGEFWVDQTAEQLLDSIGRPLAIDEKVMKTRTRETWKYNRTGSNRYALRITLDDGVVVGWDRK